MNPQPTPAELAELERRDYCEYLRHPAISPGVLWTAPYNEEPAAALEANPAMTLWALEQPQAVAFYRLGAALEARVNALRNWQIPGWEWPGVQEDRLRKEPRKWVYTTTWLAHCIGSVRVHPMAPSYTCGKRAYLRYALGLPPTCQKHGTWVPMNGNVRCGGDCFRGFFFQVLEGFYGSKNKPWGEVARTLFQYWAPTALNHAKQPTGVIMAERRAALATLHGLSALRDALFAGEVAWLERLLDNGTIPLEQIQKGTAWK